MDVKRIAAAVTILGAAGVSFTVGAITGVWWWSGLAFSCFLLAAGIWNLTQE